MIEFYYVFHILRCYYYRGIYLIIMIWVIKTFAFSHTYEKEMFAEHSYFSA